MRKKRTFILFILSAQLLLVFISCEKYLDVDLSRIKSKIVMNGFVTADSLIEIQVSKSYSYFETGQSAELLSNASLDLYVNGVFKEQMFIQNKSVNDKKITYFHSTIRPKIGEKIRIEASAEGFETAWAEITIPVPPVIEKVDTTVYLTPAQSSYNDYYIGYTYLNNLYYFKRYADSLNFEPFYRSLNMKIHIKNESVDSGHNFLVQINRGAILVDTFYLAKTSLPIYTESDPIFTRNPKNTILNEFFGNELTSGVYPYFTDNLFKNNAYTLNVSSTGYYAAKETFEIVNDENGISYYYVTGVEVFNPPVEVEIMAISPEVYAYYVEKENKDTGDGDDIGSVISEPSITYSNVHNGIGIVGAISKTKKTIDIPPYPGAKNTFPR